MKELKVLGIGSGRSGTLSLSQILNNNGFNSRHEFNRPRILQNFNRDYAEAHFFYMTERFNAEVSLFAVNYVDFVKEHYPDCKIVVIKRDKNEVIDSFVNLLKIRFKSDDLKAIYRLCEKGYAVKFDRTKDNLIDAISSYYDQVYETCDSYVEKYPGSVYKINLMDLNDDEKLDELFDFLGVDQDERNYTKVWAHKRR